MGRTAFTLRVQTGCAEPCSYCIIPSTRGAPRSVPVAEVLREIERVVSVGFKEIVLTGVHLGSYGRDLSPRSSLITLLRAIEHADATPIERTDATARSASLSGERHAALFRISSLEPMDCSPAIVDLVASTSSFARHFHLPLQHASDRMLTAMRRPYTSRYYADLVEGIRARMPDAAIGTDVIVGFPGETDAEFEALAEYLEASPLTHVHVFPYSDRPGTVASTLGNRPPGTAVRERARRVREIGQRLARRFRDAQIGTTHQALTLEDGSLVVTGNYLKLRIPPGCPRNAWVTVRVASHDDGELLAG
jgi:threonylcarbamoyladenosine tRNA methylthiotransferase MtaB